MKPTYLVFDIETVPHLPLFARIKYPTMTGEKAYAAFKEEKGEDNPFVPHTFHRPISIAVLKVDKNYEAMEPIQTISDHISEDGIFRFWQAVKCWEPILVDYNGSGFDLPVLELNAFRLGIPVPRYFRKITPLSHDYRYRYSSQHIDLQNWMSNYRNLPGGMNLLARLAGGEGKGEGMDGSQVLGYYKEGRFDEIDAYCRHDVMETYRIFLRTRVLMGLLDKDKEKELLENVEEPS